MAHSSPPRNTGCQEAMGGFSGILSSAVKSRLGLARIFCAAMATQQARKESVDDCRQWVATVQEDYLMEEVQLDGGVFGILLYPKGSEFPSREKCIVYHSPSGPTVKDFISKSGDLQGIPLGIQTLREAPILLFDYSGTGLSQKDNPRPTTHTLIKDSEAAIRWANRNFTKIEIWGTSIGGAIAPNALKNAISECPELARKVSLVSHDSFTQSSRVALPSLGWLGDGLAWLVGAQLEVPSAIDSLLASHVPVTLISREQDRHFDPECCLGNLYEGRHDDNLRVHISKEKGHASLTLDMACYIRESLPEFAS